MKSYQLITILLISIFFLCPDSSKSQQKELKFDHLTIEDGLSNSCIQDIFEDSKGYMWFATFNGLNRYDGYEFKVFYNELYNSNSLPNNRIFSITEDTDGDMIITTWDAGLCVYNYKTGKFSRYQYDANKPNSIPVNGLRQVLIDQNGSIWIATIGGGLVEFDKNRNAFYSYYPKNYPGSKHVTSLFLTQNNKIIVPFTEEGVFLFNPLSKKFTRFVDHSENPMHNSYTTKYVTQASDDKIWIGTEGDGVFMYDPVKESSNHFVENPSNPEALGINVVRDVIEDNEGEIWLATDGGGLHHYVRETGKFERYLADISNQKSLSTNQLYKLYLDKSGILWIGTYSGGVNIFNPNKEKFKLFKPVYGDPYSLSYKSVLSIIQDKENNIWIGTDGGGVNLYNPEKYGNKFIHYKNDIINPNSLVGNIVKSIFADKDGFIWFGTYQKGLDKFDPKTKRFTHYGATGRPDDLSTDLIWAIFEDSYGNFWVSCLGAGVSKMNKEKGTFQTYRPSNKPGSISQGNIMVIFEDRQQRVWMGTEGGGLNLYDHKKDCFTTFRFSQNNKNSLSSNDVRAIYQDKRGNLWIGTNGGGLNKLTSDLNKFTQYTVKDGLPANVINGILEDDDGNLWLSTTNGISKFDPEKITFRNYDKYDGLQSNEFTYTASVKTKDGQMLFGGIEGFNAFRPDEIKDNLTIPPVYITDLLIFNKLVIPGDGNKILTAPIDQVKEIHIPYNYSVITLRFTALNYTHTSKNRYSFILENFETKWNDVGNKREATYTNLDPGSYLFRVRACNNDGIWNMKGARLRIIIDPPWYLTAWAKAVFIVMIIIGLILLSVYIIHLFNSQKRRLENEKKQKLLVQQKKFEEEAIKAEREILELKNQQLQQELLVLEQEKIMNEKSEQFKQEQLHSEKEILRLKQEKLENEISYKSSELASLALHFSHKNEILIAIKEDLEKVSIENPDESSQLLKKIITSIHSDLELDDNWNQFELHFDEVHENFLKRFKDKFPDLKPLYLKLCAYIRMKLTSKQIASLMNTSLASVEKNRYRLREKLNLEDGIKLTDFIEKF